MQPEFSSRDDRIPVHILTGFLGSGKTSFLRRLLADQRLADTVVVINEFGEVALDHLLVREVAEDVVLLSSGCLCCAVGDDLISTLLDLLEMVKDGELMPFKRIIVETTGLADPAPILQAVMSDIKLRRGYRTGLILTAIDGVNGAHSISQFSEAVQQVALADRLILTKTDLIEPWQEDALAALLSKLNPTAHQMISAAEITPDIEVLLKGEKSLSPRDLDAFGTSLTAKHSEGINSFVVDPGPLEWSCFVEWLELLLASRGQSLLRVKGLLEVKGHHNPVVIHGVQHVVYPPEYLTGWPDEVEHGRLVFIARDLTKSSIEKSLSQMI